MEVFLYGSLKHPEATEEKFDVTHIGRAVMEGVAKIGNNVAPSPSEKVEGNLFTGNVEQIDEYEESFGYKSLTAPIDHENYEEGRFYAVLVEEGADFENVSISIVEED